MAELPQEGKFKIHQVGPMKSGTSKKGNAWRVFSLQFVNDPQWYDTFWTPKEEPREGMELEGKKSFDDEFTSYKFDIARGNNKTAWNPASANASVIGATAAIVNGFLALPGHYDLWKADSKELKPLFEKYMATIKVASGRVKDMTLELGSLTQEVKTGESNQPQSDGDPGPTEPPEVQTYPGDNTETDVPI